MMEYTSADDALHIPGPFIIEGKTITAKGKNMRVYRGSEEINVDEGIWIQDSNPQWQGAKQ